jgi:hypothetical protein
MHRVDWTQFWLTVLLTILFFVWIAIMPQPGP